MALVAAGFVLAAFAWLPRAGAQTRPVRMPVSRPSPASSPTPAPTPAPTPEEAQAVLQSLYGAEFKRVIATKETDDDLALANKLYAAAISSKDQPVLLAVLCEKIWELACKDPGGLRVLLDSQHLLERTSATLCAASADKLLDAMQKAYAIAKAADRAEAGDTLISLMEDRADAQAKSGDANIAADLIRKAIGVANAINSSAKEELQAKLAAISARQRTFAQIEGLMAILKTKPQDKATRERIVNLYLIDLDDPAGAAKVVNEDCEESLRTYLPLAAGNGGALAEEACLELAAWYQSLAGKNPAGKLTLLQRAKSFYELYLRKHKTADLARKAAELKLKEVRDTLIKLNPALAVGRPVFTDQATEDAFDRGVRYLWSVQKEDGSWKEGMNNHGYPTALAGLAMLESGYAVRDARMVKAFKWLSTLKTNHTIALGAVARCWTVASLSAPGTFDDSIKKDVEFLVLCAGDGSYYQYTYPGSRTRDGEAFASEFALEGVWAGASVKMQVPKKYWETALQFWTGRQNSDGGWGEFMRDRSRPPSTAAGLASLLICQEQLGQSPDTMLELPSVKSAVAWLERNHSGAVDGDSYELHQYLYFLSRAGQRAGTTTLGKIDWYKTGCDALKKLQKGDGSWEGREGLEVSTAQAILFLATGAKIPAK